MSTLSQKAGLPITQLRRLVLKELVDNALDCGAKNVDFGRDGDNCYWVQDDGPGIPGTPEQIATLFSVKRPLTSTKIIRLPVRGALGNGLRVVVGAVLASGGQLSVTTNGFSYLLQPQDDGTTKIVDAKIDYSPGTKIRITLPEGIPADPLDLTYAKLAKAFSFAQRYTGKTSAYWYDSDSFYELLQSANEMTVQTLIANFDVALPQMGSMKCSENTREQAETLLQFLRDNSKPVPAKKIGKVGNPNEEPYAKEEGILTIKPGRGSISAELPFVVEAWATAVDDQENGDDVLMAYVNGTPIVGEMRVQREKATKIAVFGCGLRHCVENVSSKKAIVRINITIPYMPITTDGKEPDFERLLAPISKVISKSTKKLKSLIRKQDNPESQTEVILKNIDEGVEKASGMGKYRFSLRQLYYALRPFCLDAGYPDLHYGHFCRKITEYEADHGEIANMYRDPRGTLYHPHLRTSIPIGTIAVEEYERPAWTFNKILYCEKEGFTNLLIASGWPERHDCALLSSKGFASRAVRDVLDLMGETEEELLFFCIHDADASGTLIYQSLQEATRARAARKVKIINLGLEPWEAVEMGLQVESFQRKGNKSSPVARYVDQHTDRNGTDGYWRRWLQRRRVELNSMTSPQFIDWLNDKIAAYDTGKVVPPMGVLKHSLEKATEAKVRQREIDRILQEVGIDDIVANQMYRLTGRLQNIDAQHEVSEALNRKPQQQWSASVDALANEIVNNGVN